MGIAHELITRGWHQGHREGPDGSVCLMGAAWKASGIENPLEYSRSTVGQYQNVALRQAIMVNSHFIGASIVSEWNDDPARTYDEVLRVAKMADEILDQQNG